MKKYILFWLAILPLACVSAQDIMEDMVNVVVTQDSSITRLMRDKRDGIVRGQTEEPGWRLQVFSSNMQVAAKSAAEELKTRLESEIDQPVYILSLQPFWKVRIGNFHTQQEALAYRDVFLQAFPDLQGDAYVVRDNILIMQ